MKIKIHNNNNSDSIIYSGTLEKIRKQAQKIVVLPEWKTGWCEEILG